jgi:hypothetical protein
MGADYSCRPGRIFEQDWNVDEQGELPPYAGTREPREDRHARFAVQPDSEAVGETIQELFGRLGEPTILAPVQGAFAEVCQ